MQSPSAHTVPATVQSSLVSQPQVVSVGSQGASPPVPPEPVGSPPVAPEPPSALPLALDAPEPSVPVLDVSAG